MWITLFPFCRQCLHGNQSLYIQSSQWSETDDQSIINKRLTASGRRIYISEQNRDLHLATGGVASLTSLGLVGGASASWTNEVSLKENNHQSECSSQLLSHSVFLTSFIESLFINKVWCLIDRCQLPVSVMVVSVWPQLTWKHTQVYYHLHFLSVQWNIFRLLWNYIIRTVLLVLLSPQ